MKRTATSHETPKHPAGRPRVAIKQEQVSQLRSQGASWRQTAKALGIGTETAMRLIRSSDEACSNTQHTSSKPGQAFYGVNYFCQVSELVTFFRNQRIQR